jgi:hypothetical protein
VIGIARAAYSVASLPPFGVATIMKHSQNDNAIPSHSINQRIWESSDPRAPNISNHRWMNLRLARNLSEGCLHLLRELNAKPSTLFFVPIECLVEFLLRDPPENERIGHRPARFNAEAITSSPGTTSSGFASSSATRRSISVICAAVNAGSCPSSNNPSQISSMSLKRSSAGHELTSAMMVFESIALLDIAR